MLLLPRRPEHVGDWLFVGLPVPGSALALVLTLAGALPGQGQPPARPAAADVTAAFWSVAVLWLGTAALITYRERAIRLPAVVAAVPGLVAVGIALAAVTPAGPADLRLASVRGWSLAWACPTSWPLVLSVAWLTLRGAHTAWLRRREEHHRHHGRPRTGSPSGRRRQANGASAGTGSVGTRQLGTGQVRASRSPRW